MNLEGQGTIQLRSLIGLSEPKKNPIGLSRRLESHQDAQNQQPNVFLSVFPSYSLFSEMLSLREVTTLLQILHGRRRGSPLTRN